MTVANKVSMTSYGLPPGILCNHSYVSSCKSYLGVGVELHQCALVRAEGQRSGLSFAVCKLEKAEPPYKFKLHEEEFSCRSSYGRLKMEFSHWLLAIVISCKPPIPLGMNECNGGECTAIVDAVLLQPLRLILHETRIFFGGASTYVESPLQSPLQSQSYCCSCPRWFSVLLVSFSYCIVSNRLGFI